MAYQSADAMYMEEAENQVILLSHRGGSREQRSRNALFEQIEHYAGKGITLSTVGFGTGNYQDELMEQLADKGDGNCSYIDSEIEIDRVFGERLSSTLRTLARDVKLQVEFNPATVKTHRLIGYENRAIADEDFRVDAVDAGEIGSGHQVTALYALTLTDATEGRLATVHIRAKPPGPEAPAQEWDFSIDRDELVPLMDATRDTRLAVAVATFAEKLRGSGAARKVSWDDLQKTLRETIDPAVPIERELLMLVERSQVLR